MTEEELAAIKARYEDISARIAENPKVSWIWQEHAQQAHIDRGELLAEVDRLRLALTNLVCRINRDGGHAMTGDLIVDAEAADLVAAERNAEVDRLREALRFYTCRDEEGDCPAYDLPQGARGPCAAAKCGRIANVALADPKP